MFKCIYCEEDKCDDQSSLEHIFPQAVGGAFLPEVIFQTKNVCKQCNHNLGIWVDGLLLKSCVFRNIPPKCFEPFIDLEQGSILPLYYMGKIKELSTNNEVCDYWLGITGESIFHFHSNDDERFITYVGGNVIKAKKTPGTVYYVVTRAYNPIWSLSCLRSFKSYFGKQKRIGINVPDDIRNNKTVCDVYFHPPTNEEIDKGKAVYKYLVDNQAIKTDFTIPIDPDHRWLAKQAIGIGFNIFGHSYLQTHSYKELKKLLWSRSLDDRKNIVVHGSGFLNLSLKNCDAVKLVTYENLITIIIYIDGDDLSLFFDFWNSWSACIGVYSPKKEDIVIRPSICESQVYYLCMPRKEAIGPLPLEEVVAHKINIKRIKVLSDIENAKPNPNPLPSRILND